jgi:hypothetical protein
MNIEKKLFVPVRPLYTLTVGVPKMWVCNIRKIHLEKGVYIREDQPILSCICQECVEIDKELYRYGRPVLFKGSITIEQLEETHVGIWFTKRGYESYKKKVDK